VKTLREALKSALLKADQDYYNAGHPGEDPIVYTLPAAILALRQWMDAEGLVCVPLDFIAGPNAWLANWAQHVGNCKGGYKCECGLVAARHDLARAMVFAAMVSAAPDVLETKP
jgi:hypothetical protein